MSEIPSTIGRYEIHREIGRGMMGVVYQAQDPFLRRHVALKTISLAFAVVEKERRQFEERFLLEARAAAALTHPNIVVVYDVGADPQTGTLFMALEFLRGRTLAELLALGQRLDWRESARTVMRLADALHHAHTHGVVHRDIKPANVMVLASGEPKIMDFGVAKFEAAQMTTGGKILGSPAYMSPEQARGRPTGTRSDLFSLGAVLYELLTGKRAFGGPAAGDVLMRVANEDPLRPTALVPELPRAVDSIVARALAKDPAARYPSGRELAEDLEDLVQGRPLRHARPPDEDVPQTMPSGAAPSPAGMAAAAPVPAGGGETTRGGDEGSLALPEGRRVALAFLSGPRQGEVFVLTRPRALIGRAGGRANADLELADTEASRVHAVVECHGARTVLRDLGSTNGTFVDERRITEREMEDRGEFRVGRTRLMLVVSQAD